MGQSNWLVAKKKIELGSHLIVGEMNTWSSLESGKPPCVIILVKHEKLLLN
jgi:hypothetical protein